MRRNAIVVEEAKGAHPSNVAERSNVDALRLRETMFSARSLILSAPYDMVRILENALFQALSKSEWERSMPLLESRGIREQYQRPRTLRIIVLFRANRMFQHCSVLRTAFKYHVLSNLSPPDGLTVSMRQFGCFSLDFPV